MGNFCIIYSAICPEDIHQNNFSDSHCHINSSFFVWESGTWHETLFWKCTKKKRTQSALAFRMTVAACCSLLHCQSLCETEHKQAENQLTRKGKKNIQNQYGRGRQITRVVLTGWSPFSSFDVLKCKAHTTQWKALLYAQLHFSGCGALVASAENTFTVLSDCICVDLNRSTLAVWSFPWMAL